MSTVGILAYGSLINNPGEEIVPLIVQRITTETPFPVEYARLSKSRGGAPTVVPHSNGLPVKAEVLVLSNSMTIDEAKNMLWRRETHNEGSKRIYEEKKSKNAVLVCDAQGFCGIDHVLYTDFNPAGKLIDLDAEMLAQAAIDSVAEAEDGMDGISYLMGLIDIGIETPLTALYKKHVLVLTGTANLEEALAVTKRRTI